MSRPTVLVIGPTPPPLHGPSIYTKMVIESPEVTRRVDIRHLDISDRRDLGNIGRLDVQNVRLALEHLLRAAWTCFAHRPDVVYLQPSQNTLAFLRDAGFIILGWLSGSRVVVHLHGEAFAHFRATSSRAVRLVIDAAHARVDEAWVLGDDLRDRYAGLVPPEKIRVLPNGIPERMQCLMESAVTERTDRRAAPPPTPDPFRVLHLGQLSRTKGTDRVVRAVREMRDVGVDARLTLAGGWGSVADEECIEALLDEIGGDWVALPGVVDGSVKARLLAEADVFVLASRFPPGEGQPLAVLEAMAGSVPVVATPRGAIPETLDRGRAGLLVDVEAGESLADSLVALARDPGRRITLGTAGRERFLSRYTGSACCDAFGRALVAAAESRS